MIEKLKFSDLEISDEIKKNLERINFEELTPVQQLSFDTIKSGIDLIGEAPTGTGKTAAYIIPSIDKIDSFSDKVQMLVLVPTRELAIQSVAEIEKIVSGTNGIKVQAIYGGQLIARQITKLKQKPQIIVSTPGRLIDHLSRHTVKLDDIKLVVLDECDEMLNMGFRPDIDKILSFIKNDHQTILFSATISREIVQISTKYQKDAKSITIKRDLSEIKNIKQYFVKAKEEEKIDYLRVLFSILNYQRMFVFVRTKRKVDKLNKLFTNEGFSIAAIHGDIPQNKRNIAMESFRNGKSKILLATDVAARGIDVNDVEVVVNYDVPEDDEYYVHRIGRTGRNNKSGESFIFFTPKDFFLKNVYEKNTNDKMEEYVFPSKGEVEIMSAKNKLNDAKEYTEQNLKEYKDLINETIEQWKVEGKEIDSLTIAAALLRASTVVERSTTVREKRDNTSRSESSPRDNHREPKTPANCQRFFINVGAKDGLDNDGLMHFICKYCTFLTTRDFKDCYIKDSFSFFELPNDKVENVIETLNETTYGKRKVNVELSEIKQRSNRREYGDKRPSSRGKSFNRDDKGSSSGYRGERKSYRKDDSSNSGFKKEYKPFKKADGESKPRNYGSRDRKFSNGSNSDRRKSYSSK